jgi:type III secretion system FlhB-like substrate exporter
MSKKQRLAEYSFRPALVVAMREAFQKACKAPQVVADGAPEVTEGVARRILELAKAGETSPDRLCTGALRKLSH